MLKHKLAVFLLTVSSVVNAQFSILHTFNDTTGMNPWGTLTLSDNSVFGMTEYGGKNGYGCIFSLDTNGSRYKDLLDFDKTNGAKPIYTQLILSQDKMFGMTSAGGAHNVGCIFSIDTNGAGYKDLYDFNSASGWGPEGSLLLLGTKLFGMTPFGATNNDGSIFVIDTNGSGYNVLLEFNGVNGKSSHGDLIFSNSVLYGMTYLGGKYDSGCIFSIDTNGNNYKDILDFDKANGAYPIGSLTIKDSILYGMTSIGGANGDGLIFSIDTNGTGYSELFAFSHSSGQNPYGSLTLSGNLLYGMTPLGGIYGSGRIFSIKIDGSGFTRLFDFDGTNGSLPNASLTLSKSNLYGVTSGGATNNNGVVFKMDTNYTLGIDQVNIMQSEVGLYPNPNNGQFAITLSDISGNSIVTIYNMLGENVYYSELKDRNTQINIGEESPGIYLYRVQLEAGDKVSEGKFIIQ